MINFTKEDQRKLFASNDKKTTRRGNQGIKLIAHFDTLDQGTAAMVKIGRQDVYRY